MHQRKPKEKVLASARRLRWNVRSFTTDGLMTRKKFLLPDFDACSVALFASLVFMGPSPGRAQLPTPVRSALVSTRVPAGPQERSDAADRVDDDAPTAQRGRSRR
jgi:hypothetical protein